MFKKKILIILFIIVILISIGIYCLQKRFLLPIYNCRETYTFESKSSGDWGTEKCERIDTYLCKSIDGCDNYTFLDKYYSKSLWHYFVYFDGDKFYIKNFMTGKETNFKNKETMYNKKNLNLSDLDYIVNSKKVTGFIDSSSKGKNYYSFDSGLVLKDYDALYCNGYEETITSGCENLVVTVKSISDSVEEVGLFNLSTNDFIKKINVLIDANSYNNEIFEFYKVNDDYILHYNYIDDESQEYFLNIYNSDGELIARDVKNNVVNNNYLIFTTDNKVLKTYDMNEGKFIKTTRYNNIMAFNEDAIAIIDSGNYLKIIDYNNKVLKTIVKLSNGIIPDNDGSYYREEIKSLIIILRDYNNPQNDIGSQYSNIEYRYDCVTGEIESY